jgi:hypothetical protein
MTPGAQEEAEAELAMFNAGEWNKIPEPQPAPRRATDPMTLGVLAGLLAGEGAGSIPLWIVTPEDEAERLLRVYAVLEFAARLSPEDREKLMNAIRP